MTSYRFRLLDLCQLKNKDKFEAKFTARNAGLLDLIDMYSSWNLSFEYILHKCDTIMPRYYTIASSSKVHPKQIAIAISLSHYKAADGTSRQGLTSALLAKRTQHARIFVKDSNFTMNNAVPLLMVGPGTGIVPFIAFCQERELMKSQGEKLAEAHLFFGCRDKDTDFIYRDFLAASVDKSVIQSMNLAFSRANDGSPKQYV